MKKHTLGAMGMIGLLGFSAAAKAVETPAEAPSLTNVTTTNTQSVNTDILNNIYLNYFGIFHGPAAGNLDSTRTPDRNGVVTSKSQPMNFDSTVVAAYKLTPTIGVGAYIPFLLVPVLGQGIVMGDLGATVYDAKTIISNGFLLWTNFVVQLPTATYTKTTGMDVAFKTTPFVMYHIPHSRFTLGSWNELKEYAGVNNVNGMKTFKAYAAPYVNYKIMKDLALNLEYEMEWHHNVGDTDGGLSTYQTDILPGFVWNITPKILVNPYLQIFTTKNAAWDTTAVGAVISATVL